mgnify:CR=1 FL=1
MANKHAVLSASSSERWLNCPPSARLCENYEDKGSDYAAEGTDAHTLCEYKLRKALGMEATDLWFDPLFLVVKGMQDKQMDVLNAIKLFADEGLKSTGGLSNNSNGAPKNVRPIMDSALVAMAMMQGLTSAIVNPNDLRLMETIKSCDIFKNNELYSDSYLDA